MERIVDETTIHGIKDFALAKSNGQKILWLSVILASVCITTYGLYNTIDEYMDVPTAVNIQLYEYNKDDFGLPFVAFCPHKFFNRESMNQMNLTDNAAYYILTTLRNLGNLTQRHDINATVYSTGKAEVQKAFNLTNQSVVTWLRDQDIGLFDCTNCYADYPKRIVTTNGVCFLLQSNGVERTEYKRVQIRFQFKHEPSAFIPSGLRRSTGHTSPLVKIDADIYNDLPENEVEAPVGQTTTIKVSTSYFKQLSKPWNNDTCLDVATHKVNDTKRMCDWSCFDYAGAKIFNCEWPTTNPNVTVTNMCDTFQFNQSIPAKQLYDTCAGQCTKVCTRVDYIVIPVYTAYAGLGWENISNVVVTFQNSNGVIFMSESTTYSWDTLVGNIGGVLGLYLGASMMSFLQLAYLCFAAAKLRITSRKTSTTTISLL